MNFWQKRTKNIDEAVLTDLVNENKTKVKALKNNELEIGGKTMERTLNAINEAKLTQAIKKAEAWKWLMETDLKKKREEFGYISQSEVARKIKCNPSIINRLERHKEEYGNITPRLMQVYEFYTNDFNKKIPGEDAEQIGEVKMKRRKPNIKKADKEIWKWYKSTNFKALRKSLGLTGYELAEVVGVAQSCISDLELKRYTGVNKTIRGAYKFYSQKELPKVEEKEPEVVETVYKPENTFVTKEPLYQLEEQQAEIDSQKDYIKELEHKLQLAVRTSEIYEHIIELIFK